MITSRVLVPTDADIQDMLDKMHVMSEENYRPWWACSNPPYPSRNEMSRMVDGVGKFVVINDGPEVVGWYYFGSEGEILAGATRHEPSHGGYRAEMDQPAMDILHKAAQTIIAQTGSVSHLAVNNPRVWYGLEVQCGIPRHSSVMSFGPTPTEPPPLPDGVEVRD